MATKKGKKKDRQHAWKIGTCSNQQPQSYQQPGARKNGKRFTKEHAKGTQKSAQKKAVSFS